MQFDDDELTLIEGAQIILLTGWTWEEYLEAPLAVVDAMQQIHQQNKRLQKEREAKAYKRRRRGR